MINEEPQVMSREEVEPATGIANRALEQLDRILLGRNDLHTMVLAGILSRGHVLLEGLPGLGKTALVRALGSILKLDFKRVQFTPDLMPGDILGNHILQESGEGSREMVFHPGPVFTNILLADEINRASPKTQSAMLETMQEGSVTLMGTTRQLPFPFFVLASQNPIELEGTYPLPEAQIDRFMFKLLVSNVNEEVLDSIISTRHHGVTPEPEWQATPEELESVFKVVDRVYLPRAVSRYIARLTAATHPDSEIALEKIRTYVEYGASPRAAIAMAEAARAMAVLNGRPSVGFEDVKAVAQSVLNHRVILNYKARIDAVKVTALIDELLAKTDEVGLDLPEDIKVEA